MILDNAREVTAECLDVRADEVTFTSSGTDAVHRGLLGLHRGRARIGSRVLLPGVEHSSVLHALDWTGAPCTEIPVPLTGRVRVADVLAAREAQQDPVALAVLQTGNHEVGTLQPVAEVAAALADLDIPLFTDACATMGRLPLPGGWAVAAGSAHKFGGPAGIGLLLVRNRARWRNPFPTDDRLDVRTSGFENVPAALATAAALRASLAEAETVGARQRALVERIRAVAATWPDVEVVGDPDERLPHVLTFSALYVDGEALVDALEREGFSVGSGSACTASTLTPSHVLAAMGVLTHGNVRIGLEPGTTDDQVDRFLAVVPRVLAELRARVGL